MPSGPKKRKAAKRKQQELGMNPDSPSNKSHEGIAESSDDLKEDKSDTSEAGLGKSMEEGNGKSESVEVEHIKSVEESNSTGDSHSETSTSSDGENQKKVSDEPEEKSLVSESKKVQKTHTVADDEIPLPENQNFSEEAAKPFSQSAQEIQQQVVNEEIQHLVNENPLEKSLEFFSVSANQTEKGLHDKIQEVVDENPSESLVEFVSDSSQQIHQVATSTQETVADVIDLSSNMEENVTVLLEKRVEISEPCDQNPESSSREDMVISAPPPLQPSLWKGCCGLFDVLMGSRR